MAVDRSKNNGAVGMFNRKSVKANSGLRTATSGQDMESSKAKTISKGKEDAYYNSIPGKLANKIGEGLQKYSTTGTWKSVGETMQKPNETKPKKKNGGVCR